MLTDTRAASMAEYAIIAAIILVIAVAAFQTFGAKIVNALNAAGGEMDKRGP
jgi:Flp pilus assembly pilin Flp